MSDRPATRTNDHETSELAADKLEPEVGKLRLYVERFAYQKGEDGLIDDDLIATNPDMVESTLRKRRTELAQMRVIGTKGGKRFNRAGNKETVWHHRDFLKGIGPRLPKPPVKAKDEERQELAQKARASAAQLDRSSRQMRIEGRTMFASALDEAADLLRRLA